MFAESAVVGSVGDIGRVNAATVVRSLLRDGPIARTEVAERTGLTRATVTRATAKLIDMGIVVEGEPIRSFGRPMIPIDLRAEHRLVVSIHVGVTLTRVGLVDVRGRIVQERKRLHVTTEPAGLVDDVCRVAREMLAEHAQDAEVIGVGASIGGWVDTESGVVVRYTPLGWSDVPLVTMIAERLHLPVMFDHMVRGMALSEMMFGSARDVRDFLQIYVGDVLGAASVDAGIIRRGPRGAAGSIDHLPVSGESTRTCSCGRRHCAQWLVTDRAVRDDAVALGLAAAGVTMDDLVASEDDGVLGLLDERARLLGEAVGLLIDFVNPSLLLLAGPQTRRPGFLAAFRSGLSVRSDHGGDLDLPVRIAGFGDSTPTPASAALCLDAYYRDPIGYLTALRASTVPTQEASAG